MPGSPTASEDETDDPPASTAAAATQTEVKRQRKSRKKGLELLSDAAVWDNTDKEIICAQRVVSYA